MRHIGDLSFAASLLVSAAAAGPVHAQGRFEFAPFVGVYTPTRPVLLDSANSALAQERARAVYGARLAYRLLRRLDLEAAVGMASGELELFDGTAADQVPFASTTLLLDVRARIQLAPPDAPARVHAIVGLGTVRSRNAFFDFFEDAGALDQSSPLAVVLGVGTVIRLPGALRLRLDLEDRFYETELVGAFLDDTPRAQHDLAFTGGVAVGF